MSTDARVAKGLVETLKDGRDGFTSAAERLRGSDRPELAATMQRFAEQRAQFAGEIVAMGHDYGDDVDDSGSAAGALHRGWIKVKDAVTGDDPGRVLGAAVSGEDHAVSEYEKALGEDVSDGFRAVLQRQHSSVVAARDEVEQLQHHH